jgi:hypothetical protein
MLSVNFVYRNQSAKNAIKQGVFMLVVVYLIESILDRSQL